MDQLHPPRAEDHLEYGRPFDPWPPLPDSALDEFDWRAARDQAAAELRLQREQERL